MKSPASPAKSFRTRRPGRPVCPGGDRALDSPTTSPRRPNPFPIVRNHVRFDPSKIDLAFARLRDQGRMAFMPFITAGDPDVDTTARLIELLADAGVDLIEIGFPYSDPIADGPVIQASYQRALSKGLHVADVFRCVRELTARRSDLPPLVGMVAYSLIFRIGTDKFLSDAKSAGFSGLIVPDFPADEAVDFAKAVVAHGLDPVQLIAPTTTAARTATILETSRGFLYCISVAGTTGVRRELPRRCGRSSRTCAAARSCRWRWASASVVPSKCTNCAAWRTV